MWAQGSLLSYNQSMRIARGLPGKSHGGWYRLRSPIAIGLILGIMQIAWVGWGNSAHGQSQSPLTPQLPPAPGQNTQRPQSPGQEADSDQDSAARRQQMEAAIKRRNLERQTKIAADSDKIVRLAEELSVSFGPDEVNAASPAMAKKAEEIGKLARNVKDLMKSE